MSEKPSQIAIRIAQALLFVVGIGWAYTRSNCDFAQMQIPGFLIAMSISWWLTPEIRARALKLGLVDKPGEERRIHTKPIPRLGGVAIFIGVILTITVLIAIAGRFPRDARVGEGGLAGIAIGGTVIFVLGLVDDLDSIKAKVKFLVQIIAGCAAYSLGVRIKSLPIPLNMDVNIGPLHTNANHAIDLGGFGLPFTVFWLVGIANAVNLIDGMDGLAAGVSAISAVTIWSVALAAEIHRPYAALCAAVLAGALLGFLRWNFNPARIFLGDSGAYLTGFILGGISIMGVIKGAAATTVIVPTFVLVLLILFFPIADTSFAIIRRVASRRPIFSPDRGHIHHRLLDQNLSQKHVAYVIYGISAALGLVAALFVHQGGYFIKLTGVIVLMALFFAEVLNRHRQRKQGVAFDDTEDTDDGDEEIVAAEPAHGPEPTTDREQHESRTEAQRDAGNTTLERREESSTSALDR